ncbi:MAG: exostosin family protein [Chthoniobacterales bacterium]|nr:exostosin family protein [Chthoniobacterales bacterium]
MGSMENATVRRDLMTLKHPRGFIQDTSAEFARVLQRAMNAAERRDYHRRYADITKASKFVLCPRGLSVSSIRLFETMKMGRVPVILSDGWVEPPGPAWANSLSALAKRTSRDCRSFWRSGRGKRWRWASWRDANGWSGLRKRPPSTPWWNGVCASKRRDECRSSCGAGLCICSICVRFIFGARWRRRIAPCERRRARAVVRQLQVPSP